MVPQLVLMSVLLTQFVTDSLYQYYLSQDTPRQQNGYDCGIWVVKFGESLLCSYSKTFGADKDFGLKQAWQLKVLRTRQVRNSRSVLINKTNLLLFLMFATTTWMPRFYPQCDVDQERTNTLKMIDRWAISQLLCLCARQ